MQELNQKDLAIVSHFRNNARRNLTSISKETSIPVSTLFEKLKRLEESIITRHTSLIDFTKIGFGTIAKVLIKAKKGTKLEVSNYLSKHENINSVSSITNGYDFEIEAIFRNMNELEKFIETIDDKLNIDKKSVYYVIGEIKREKFLIDFNPETSLIMQNN
jgi:DNA-binding Lrp family transcriptional regulator